MNAAELLTALRTRGALDEPIADAPATTTTTAIERPIAISVLLGVSGWVAGLFMLACVAMLFHPDDPIQAGTIGAVLLAAAWGLFRVDRDGGHVFVVQLALALSIAGQCLMLFAISDHDHGIAPIAAKALVLQAALALLMPNRLHRTLSTIFAAIAWALLTRFGLFGEPRGWTGGDDLPPPPLGVAVAAWLTAWAPVGLALVWLVRSEAAWMARRWQPLLRPVLDGLIVGLAVATLASQPLESRQWLGMGADANMGGLALWALLSALGAIAALLTAFAMGRRGLMALCIAAALLHLSFFYYTLGTTLLIKSALMLAMGAIALLAARALRSKELA